jgi:hypothetical protein
MRAIAENNRGESKRQARKQSVRQMAISHSTALSQRHPKSAAEDNQRVLLAEMIGDLIKAYVTRL